MEKTRQKSVVICLLIMVIILLINNIYTEKAVNTCIEKGKSVQVCNELRRN